LSTNAEKNIKFVTEHINNCLLGFYEIIIMSVLC